MNLYLISQSANNGWDTYDSAVVAADSEDAARAINPDGEARWAYTYTSWCKSPDLVTVQLLGVAMHGTASGVILSSFNAG